MIAMPWFVLTTTGSATQTGLVAAAEIAPLVMLQGARRPADRPGRRAPGHARLRRRLGRSSSARSRCCTRSGCCRSRLLLVLVALAGALRGPGRRRQGRDDARRSRGSPASRWSGRPAWHSPSSAPRRWLGAALAGGLVAVVGAANALFVDAVVVRRLRRRPRLADHRAGPPGPRREADDGDADAVPARAAPGLGLPAQRAGAARDLRDGGADQPARPRLRAVLVPVWAKESGAGGRRRSACVRGLRRGLGARRAGAAAWGETLPRYRTYLVAFLIAARRGSW